MRTTTAQPTLPFLFEQQATANDWQLGRKEMVGKK
jgi:hypothetical protein